MSEEAAGGTTQPATIVVLPDELWLHLLAFLKEQDVVSLHFVNRHLYRLAEDDAVWRALFVAKYPEQLHDRALARHGWKERLRLVHACWHHGKFAVRHSLATHTRFGGIRFANFAEDDENLIVGGSTQGHIVIWNLDKEPSSEQSNRDSTQDDTTDPSVEHIAAHSQWVNLVKLMPDLAGSVADSTTLLSASDDNTIGQWDIERGVCVRTFDGHTGWVLALDCDANTIVSAGSVQPINIWDARSGSRRSIPCGRDLRMNEKPVKELPQPDTLWTLQLSGSRLLTGGDHSDMHLSVQSLQFSATRIVSASLAGRISVWGPDYGQP
ncbi:Fbox domain containing protein [Acanthamoeba castellanii str. Neff]|uniref:Fbox domain containing protein n=1 Tax=Acanthamoeba castellanii (strain ATCC 30010 / Neff) TaxID=1257118 RepID=L8HEL2_ACACF|nr:Fbox domain containing protein [Acanthamoeba castellanii str. Neff]ELR23667.1 Fbox domain containing protein [Acanthamoeba castellanii str. Neff]